MPRKRKYVAPKETSLPASISDRKLLDSLLDECVGHLRDQDRSKQNYKGAVQVATDSEGKLNLCPKYFNALVRAKYDLIKIESKAGQLQSSVDDVRVLTNKEKS